MRPASEPRVRRLLLRVPRANLYSLAELALLSLLAFQCARLVWTIVTPVGPLGDWRLPASLRAPATASSALDFDPFFRLSGPSGPVVVTSLSLQLFGVRQDEATGRGSAIIATPDGKQSSFAVGDEIVPGVRLKAVDFDSVTIDRGGTTEQLFMDQSKGAATAMPVPTQGSVPAPPPINAPPPISVVPRPAPAGGSDGAAGLQPRMNGRQITGVTVSGFGGDIYRAAGLQPGDVVISANGRRIASPEQARALGGQLGAGPIILQVERGGRVITLRPGMGR
jgi:general secretion pathway protein C